jgi:23S rRNA pseudouridine1911/1915/1917 synthase
VRHLGDRPDASRARVQAWIAAGLVRVNGVPAGKPAGRLALGDAVAALLPPPPPPRPRPVPQDLPLAVLYEDDHLLAVDKPPGLVVHPTPGRRDGTLLNALLWRARSWADGCRPGLVNRLDKGTSGIVLVAKTGAAHGRLARALRSPAAEKEYLALVYGRPPLARGRIERKLVRDVSSGSRRMAASRTAGRDAVTLYEVLAETRGEGTPLTLLRCLLRTGRTHQIRVHLESAGLPIVGDPVYGASGWKGLRDLLLAALCRDLPRQALHARRLAFVHPATGEPLEIVAPLPQDLAVLLAAAGLAAASINSRS